MTLVYEAVEWMSRRCNFLGLEWSFTTYEFTNHQLYISEGCLHQSRAAYHITSMKQVSLEETLWQKIIHTGDVVIETYDKERIVIENVKYAEDLFDMLNEEIKDRKRFAHYYIHEK